MPIAYARRLVGRERSEAANRHLGGVLAFVAGAVNAGGYVAVGQYTSHMTGIVSGIANNAVLGGADLVLGGVAALVSFVCGAGCSAWLVGHARRKGWHSEYAVALLVEAALLLCFGLMGARLSDVALFVPATVMLLCGVMGLQNALISKLSRAEIRTTHVTGMLTDIGIELGRRVAGRHASASGQLDGRDGRSRLRLLLTLVGLFFVGGLAGTLGFERAGYAATLPLAAALIAAAVVPVADDLGEWAGRRRR